MNINTKLTLVPQQDSYAGASSLSEFESKITSFIFVTLSDLSAI